MIYLKFTDEAEAHQVLADFMDQDTDAEGAPVGDPYFIGRWKSPVHGQVVGEYELWVRGTLNDVVATTSDGDEVEFDIIPLEGFHVDIRHADLPIALAAYVIEPTAPKFA